jgi:hypothetical protein
MGEDDNDFDTDIDDTDDDIFDLDKNPEKEPDDI